MNALSAEDRARIYEEEKARLEARDALLKPRRRKRIIQFLAAGIVLGIALIVIWVLPDVQRQAAQAELAAHPEARSAFLEASSVMVARPEVLRIGNLETVNRIDGGWRFEVDAVYKTDAGIVQRGILIAKASRNGSGWDVQLNR